MSARVAPPNASEVWRVNRRRVLGGGLVALGAALGGGGGATRTVEHKYGATEVPTDPQRVVTVGFSDQGG